MGIARQVDPAEQSSEEAKNSSPMENEVYNGCGLIERAKATKTSYILAQHFGTYSGKMTNTSFLAENPAASSCRINNYFPGNDKIFNFLENNCLNLKIRKSCRPYLTDNTFFLAKPVIFGKLINSRLARIKNAPISIIGWKNS